jgi:hypothetical protein
MQSFVVNMDQCQRVVVVCGNGQILNSIQEEILKYSQRLLDALGNLGWNAMAIKDVVSLLEWANTQLCCSVFNWQKSPSGSANMVAKKEEQKKRKEKMER